MYISSLQVDEPLRVCKVCAVELVSAKCARFGVQVAPKEASGKGSGVKGGSTLRPTAELPVFQSEADAKLADAMVVLQRYREEHEVRTV